MASCEKCWRDSRGHDEGAYSRLVSKRDCTPEEQAGEGFGARSCPRCGRMTVHVYCHVCMVSGCGYDEAKVDSYKLT